MISSIKENRSISLLCSKLARPILLLTLSLFVFVSSYANNEENSKYQEVEGKIDSMMILQVPGFYIRDYARKQYNEAIRTNSYDIEVLTSLAIANTYYTGRKNYDSVNYYLYKSYAKLDKIKNVTLHNRIRYFSAVIDYDLGDIDAAIKGFNECILNNKGQGPNKELVILYNALGATYQKAEQFDSAYYYFRKSGDLALSLFPKHQTWVRSYYNLASLQLDNMEIKKASENIKFILELSEKSSINEGFFYAGLLYSKYYLTFNKSDSARYWLNFSKKHFDSKHSTMQLLRYNQYLVEFHTQTNNADSAVYYLENQMKLKDSLSLGANELKLVNTQRFYTDLLRDLEQDQFKQTLNIEKQKNSFYLIIIILSLLLFGLITYFAVIFYKRIVSSLRRDKEGVMLKLVSANQSIDYKEKSIASFALDMVRRNEFMEYMLEEVDQLMHLDRYARERRLKEMKMNINAVLEINSDSKEILQQTTDVSADFYAKLESILPSISNKEKRLCVLVRLGLRQKEISIILKTPLNSVNSNIYRLKKKFGLSKTTSFKEYLLKL